MQSVMSVLIVVHDEFAYFFPILNYFCAISMISILLIPVALGD
jgi:hypothetical protein